MRPVRCSDIFGVSLGGPLSVQNMARFEEYANGSTTQHVVYDHSHPRFFNLMPTLPNAGTISGQTSLFYATAPDAAMYNGQCEIHYVGGVALEHAEPLQGLMWPSYLESCFLGDLDNRPNEGVIFDSAFADLEPLPGHGPGEGLGDCLYDSGLKTERLDDGYSPMSPSSFDSVQVSDSTCTPGPTTTTSPEYMIERLCCTADVAKKQSGMLKGVTKGKVNRKRKRSVESKKNPCEIRISKKIPKDGKYLKEKAWLGTFATPAEKGRALDVGKFFLSTKKKKNFFDSNSEVILPAFKEQLHALPLTELVDSVTKMAKHYGENGSFTGYQGFEARTRQP